MTVKQKTVLFIDSVLAVAAGMAMLLDACGAGFSGALDRWYILLTAYVTAIILVFIAVYRRPNFMPIAMLFLGLFSALEMMRVDFDFAEVWYLMPIFVGLGLFIANIFNKRRFEPAVFSVMLSLVSLAVMLSVIYSVWQYVVPGIIIFIGIFIAIAALTYRVKTIELKNTVYYVEPSEDSEQDNKED